MKMFYPGYSSRWQQGMVYGHTADEMSIYAGHNANEMSNLPMYESTPSFLHAIYQTPSQLHTPV